MDQLLHIHTGGVQADGKDTFHNHRYEPTPYEWIEQLYDNFFLSSTDTLVDFGCGKGRLNFYVSYRFGCHTKGIEYNPNYYKIALDNLDSYVQRKHSDIRFFLCQAQDYPIAPEDTVFYFFNPFSPPIFMKVMTNIQKSLEQEPRKAYCILYYPDEAYVDFLENHTYFELIKTVEITPHMSDPKERFLIYSTAH
ncbi:MAG: SAM-dependent methyltransferase [Clostridiales bacterium]|nr:SAM-dependent methyltransferase [Clostridiales bacterium]